MASIGIMLAAAVANAMAFTGGQVIYRASVAGPNPEEERERHDKAVEALNKATAEWGKKRLQALDFVNRKLRREGVSKRDFKDVDAALELYGRTHPAIQVGRRPTLSDFYQPSESQKNFEYVFIVGSVAVTGLLAYKFL